MSSAGSDACRLLLSLSLSIDSEGVALVFLELEQNTVTSYWRILLSQDCFTALCIGLYHFANSFSTSEPRFPTVFDRKYKKEGRSRGNCLFALPVVALFGLRYSLPPRMSAASCASPHATQYPPSLLQPSARISFCNCRRRRSGSCSFSARP